MERTTRYSKKREAILTAIRSTNCHPSAEWVYQTLKPEHPDLSLGTVYRNLKLMERDGEVAHLEMAGGPDRYDCNPVPHGHLLCDGCGELSDLPVVGLIREVEAAIGTEVRGYTLTIHYLCPQCRAKNAQ